jgi:hypothetical protein
VAEVGGVPQVIGLHIEAAVEVNHAVGEDEDEQLVWRGPKGEDPTITTDLLRQLPMRQLRASAVKEAYERGSDLLEPFKLERTPGQPWPDEHFQAVAEVYRNADSAPLVAIKDRWNVSRAAASKWVARARELGYLGYPQRRGVSGASEKQSPIKRQKEPRRST